MVDINKLTTHYQVRILKEEDLPSMYELACSNPLYYEYCSPFVTIDSLREDMYALPPKITYEDKFFVGYFDGERLVAILDLITNYPNNETAFIGFFMLHKECQGMGVGSILVAECCNCLKQLHYKYVRLGYVKGNPQSEAFWLKNEFVRTGVEMKQERYTVVVLQRELY